MRPTITACGNLTKTPALEKTKSGTPVVRFTVACNAGKEDEPTFLWCVAYNKAAENIAKFFEKGSPIVVSGELRQYTDEKREAHFVCDVRNFGFVGGGRKNDAPPPPDERRSAPRASEEPSGDVAEAEEPF